MKNKEKQIKDLSLSEVIQESKKLNKQKEDNESSKMSVIILTLASLFTNIMRIVPGDYLINSIRCLLLFCVTATGVWGINSLDNKLKKIKNKTNLINEILESFSRSFATKGYDISKQELINARIVINKNDNTCQRIYVKKEDSSPIVIVEHKKDELNEILEESYKMYEYKINEDTIDLKYIDDLMEKEFDSVKKIQK